MNIIEQLIQHDENYEVGKPTISDRDYDLLKAKARHEYPRHPYFQIVGAPVKSDKVKLPVVLGSLNKVKGTDGTYQSWCESHKGSKVYWAKLDGSSLYVEYVDGKLVKAYTRGNGEIGRDVTVKAHLFCPIEVNDNFTGSIRGEVMLTGDIYKELGYVTRRNGAAGLLNQDELDNVDNLVFKVYELISDSDGVPDKEMARIERLEGYGFELAPYQGFNGDMTQEQLINLLQHYRSNGYDVDGIVVALNDSIREDVKKPEDKVAWKINEEAVPCEVVDVEWNVGRTGVIVPTVVITPTIIDGVEVSRSAGFNADFIMMNGVDKGSIVNVIRSGGVIPWIESVDEMITNDPKLDKCPSCGGPVEWKGVHLICINDPFKCPDRLMQILEHYLVTLGAENITATTLKKLDITSIQGLYELDEFEISELDGFGIKRAEQIIFEIRKTLKTTPDKLLASFGITNVGIETARSILKVYDFDGLWDLTMIDLTKIEGIGDKIAYNFVEEIGDYKVLYEYLKSIGLKWATNSNTLRGKIFTLTGDGPLSRDTITKMIESNGGFSKGISKKSDYVVAADPNSNSGKAKKAREYGITIISYEELLEMMK